MKEDVNATHNDPAERLPDPWARWPGWNRGVVKGKRIGTGSVLGEGAAWLSGGLWSAGLGSVAAYGWDTVPVESIMFFLATVGPVVLPIFVHSARKRFGPRPVAHLDGPGLIGDSIVFELASRRRVFVSDAWLTCVMREGHFASETELCREGVSFGELGYSKLGKGGMWRTRLQINIPDGLPPTTTNEDYPRVTWAITTEIGSGGRRWYRFVVPVFHQVVRE